MTCRLLRWLGWTIISLLIGVVVGCFSHGIIETFIPFYPDDNYNAYGSDYDRYESKIHILQYVCLAWSSGASFAALTSTPRIRFHLLFLHGMAFLCLAEYFLWSALCLMRAIHWAILKEAAFYQSVMFAYFFLLSALVLLMFGLIVNKTEDQQRRAQRRKSRIFN